jgi:hypothetical protein
MALSHAGALSGSGFNCFADFLGWTKPLVAGDNQIGRRERPELQKLRRESGNEPLPAFSELPITIQIAKEIE